MLALRLLVLVLAMISGTFSKSIQLLPLKKAQERIIAGLYADETGYKFHVQVLYQLPMSICVAGGSIISPRYVLTTASTYVSKRQDISTIDLYIGSVFQDKGEKIEVSPNKVTPHENYQESPLQNDIALIQTPRNIIYSGTVQPAKLPKGRVEILRDHRVQTVGFGLPCCEECGGTLSSRLLMSNMVVLDGTSTECTELYGPLDVDKLICAKSIDGRRPTFGDGGGALVLLERREPDNPIIFGILSFGPNNEVRHNVPVVYTRVDSYVNWIHTTTNEVLE